MLKQPKAISITIQGELWSPAVPHRLTSGDKIES